MDYDLRIMGKDSGDKRPEVQTKDQLVQKVKEVKEAHDPKATSGYGGTGHLPVGVGGSEDKVTQVGHQTAEVIDAIEEQHAKEPEDGELQVIVFPQVAGGSA